MAFFILIFFMLLVSVSPSPSSSASSWLTVSPKKFVESANEVRTFLEQMHSTLSTFNNNTSGLPNGIQDCLDLLDMSSEQLRMSMSAMQNPKGKDHKLGTGNLSSDLRTWLSAVLTNSDTCIEGLEQGTAVKGLASKDLNRVMSMVKTLLAQVIPVHVDQVKKDQFPSWISEEDKMLLRENFRVRTPDAVVATDGTGDYSKVTDAIRAAPDYSMKRFVIYVRRGIYLDEYVRINATKWNIMLLGDGIGATVISGSRNYADGYKTFNTATFAVDAVGFIACNISFENTAGPEKDMAVALRSDSDLSIFYRCGIYGYQDSLYPHSKRQFYKECIIAGTVDFIFGDATAVFQSCQILAKQGTLRQKNTITAQGRIDPGESTGFSFQFCNISADYDLKATTETYLGRPWRNFSRTIFMESHLSNVIDPKGWLEMDGTHYSDTSTYCEYSNFGAGAKLDNRVKWPGYYILDEREAQEFSVDKFIEGNLWLPSSGINYTGGL
ncbi:pectinesterase/pectinesterase inhibitor PPE8B-like [Trifolium pratense]|uniref:pectinesterase/pectinesterase inhibitor PPE8B-like n=1 Tax=Trifolium pratense TaxID=57577 RepID=UPI001E691BC5|nr:pectinesterase/pectinesterase inhibitor PPE8B-like [Trifolium pratense]